MDKHKTRKILSVFAIAIVFLIFGIWELVDPAYWSAFVPAFINFINPSTMVFMHGIVLIAVSLGLFIKKSYRISVILASLIMLEIVSDLFISSGLNAIGVRDLGLLILAISLCFDEPIDFFS